MTAVAIEFKPVQGRRPCWMARSGIVVACECRGHGVVYAIGLVLAIEVGASRFATVEALVGR